MKKLPEIKNSCEEIYRIFRSCTQRNILIFAIRHKVFDALMEPVSAWEVADRLNFERRNTELFLNVLTGMDVINKKNGLFYNSGMSEEFLVTSNSTYLGGFFLFMAKWNEKIEENLEKLIVNGAPDKSGIGNMRDENLWAESARVSSAYQFCGPAQYIRDIVEQLEEFPEMKKMLDLGGGGGFYTIAIVSSHPDLKGVIFEQPAVAEVAEEYIEEYEAGDRISVMKGNYVTDPIGDSYDLVFASATLNFVKNQMDYITKKVYDSLNPGGLFITHQDGVRNERTKPVEHIAEMLSAELQGMDFAITQGMIADSMKKTGFQRVRNFTIDSDFGEMEITIGKKLEVGG